MRFLVILASPTPKIVNIFKQFHDNYQNLSVDELRTCQKYILKIMTKAGDALWHHRTFPLSLLSFFLFI